MSPATLAGPGIDVEVSLAIGAAAPSGVWDSGTWSYNTWTAPDTPLGDWTDITCDVPAGLQLAAGSSPDGVVTRWEAQTCAFSLLGEIWDPRSGPYAGLLGPALPVRVRWRPTPPAGGEWRTAFLGQTTDDGFTYDPKTARARVAATDGTAALAAFNGLEQSPQGAGETAAQRVARIADTAGWPAGRRDIAPGGVAVQATTLADAAWPMLLAVADTDLALLWVSRAGNLSYRPNGKVVPSRTIAAVIGCATPPAPPANLLDPESAGFEAGTLGHWSAYQGGTIANSFVQAHGGARSLALTSDASTNPAAFIGYPTLIPVAPGAAYRVSAWYWSARGASVILNVWWIDAGGRYVDGHWPIVASRPGEWTEVVFEGIAPPAAASIQLLPGGQDNPPAGEVLYMDDFSIVQTAPAPANLLSAEQSSFEGGTLAGWATDGSAYIANINTAGYAGSHSLALTAILTTPYGYILVPGGEGRQYRASAMVYDLQGGKRAGIFLNYYDAGGAFLGQSPPVYVATTVGVWLGLAVEGVAVAGTKQIGVIVQFLDMAAPEAFYVDDVRLGDMTAAATPPAGPPEVVPVNIVGQQPTITRNIVSISRQARDDTDTPATVTVRDEPSVSRFLAHTYSRTDLIHNDDAWTPTIANAVLMSSAWPSSAPASVDLSSRADPGAGPLLLTLEPAQTIEVDDGRATWLCEPAGWDMTITPAEIAGRVDLLDVTAWYGGSWDRDGWDLGRWGL